MNEHKLALSENYTIEGNYFGKHKTNLYFLNEGSENNTVKWIKRNVGNNSGSFIIAVQSPKVRDELRTVLKDRNYHIEDLDLSKTSHHLCIDPFRVCKNTDSFVKVLTALINTRCAVGALTKEQLLIHAMAQYVREFDDENKRTFRNFIKVGLSIKLTLTSGEPIYKALFNAEDKAGSESVRLYNRFLKEVGDEADNAAAVAYEAFFTRFTNNEIETITANDITFNTSLTFKTAYIVTCTDISQMSLFMLLLSSCIQNAPTPLPVLFITDYTQLVAANADIERFLGDNTNAGFNCILLDNNISKFHSANALDKSFFKSFPLMLVVTCKPMKKTGRYGINISLPMYNYAKLDVL